MKTTRLIAAIVALALAACVQTETTAPDGTVTRTTAPAPGTLELAGKAIDAFAPAKPIPVEAEK